MKKLSLLFLALIMVFGCIGGAFAADGVSTKGLTVTPLGEAKIWTDKTEYRVGDDVKISFKSSIDGYAAIYDYASNGKSQMVWPRNGQPAYIRGGRTYSLPDGDVKEIKASEPLGTDTLVLVVSKARSNFSVNLNLSWVWGSGQKGLSADSGGYGLLINPNPDSDTMTAYWSFEVLPKLVKAVVRVYGGNGARIFVDGHDMGLVAPTNITLDTGSHQLVAIMPGMRVEYKDFTVKPNNTYNWWLRLSPVK